MYSLFLAARYIKKRIIVWLGILSITAAVVVFVVVMSVLEGFSEHLREMVRRTTSHVDISRPYVGGFSDWETVVDIAEETQSEFIAGATPYVQGPALLQSQRFRFYGFIKGVDWQRELDFGHVTPYVRIPLTLEEIQQRCGLAYETIEDTLAGLIEKGLVKRTEDYDFRTVYMRDADRPILDTEEEKAVFGALKQPPEKIEPNAAEAFPGSIAVIVGHRIWEEMELRRGEPVRASVQAGFEGDMKKAVLSVMGEFQTGNLLFDHWALVNLDDAQRIYDMNDSVHGIGIWLKDYQKSTEVRNALRKVFSDRETITRIRDELPGEYRVRTWRDQQQDLFEAISIENTIMRLIFVLFFLLIGVFILSILYVMVSEKVRDIGILTAVGGTPRGIVSIFLLDGLFVGVIGTGLGLLLGLLLAWNVNEVTHTLGLDVFPQSIFHVERIPVKVMWQDLVLVSIVAVGTSLLASVVPALKAALADPVKSLRHE